MKFELYKRNTEQFILDAIIYKDEDEYSDEYIMMTKNYYNNYWKAFNGFKIINNFDESVHKDKNNIVAWIYMKHQL